MITCRNVFKVWPKMTLFPVWTAGLYLACNLINVNAPFLRLLPDGPPPSAWQQRGAGRGGAGHVAYFLVFLCTQASRVLMAFLWSFTDSPALLSAVGVGGKEESESVPPEPGDRLEDGEFLLRLPVSSFIWKERVTSDPEQTSSDHGDQGDPDWRDELMQNWVSGWGKPLLSGCMSGDRAGPTVT